MSVSRSILAAVLAASVCACAVSEPLSVQSTGAGLTRGGSVALTIDSAETDSARGRFGAALTRAFEANASALNPAGEFAVDFAFALGDAAEGIGRGEASATPAWLAPPRKGRRFDKCKPQRLRATLVLFERTSGAIIYRGSATGIECGFSERDTEAMAQALVRDAIKAAR